MLSINTNKPAFNAATIAFKISSDLEKTQMRMATGKKINSAADNPAGLVIVKQLDSQIAGVEQAINNTKNGISLIKTAENALDEMNKLLEKAKKLTLDNLNASTSAEAREANQTEINNIVQTINRIAQNTRFGTTNLLDGTFSNRRFQLGEGGSEFVTFSISNMQATQIGVVTGNAYANLNALDGLNSGTANYSDVLAVINDAINDVTAERGRLGAFQSNTLETNLNSLNERRQQLLKSKGVIEDADMAEESVTYNKQLAQYQLALLTLQQSNQRAGQILSLFG
ncbi:MAG: flagellin [Candidatus Dojkabacteria bacterium]|nr:flagellin [Candidatus Dojkabacteria bacterium]